MAGNRNRDEEGWLLEFLRRKRAPEVGKREATAAFRVYLPEVNYNRKTGRYTAKSSLQLKAFSDPDWAGCKDTRRSITGFCVFLGDSLISWKTKKHIIVSRSSTEAEYRVIAAVTCEIVWLRHLLHDFDISSSTPTSIYCDNQSAIELAHNPTFHERTKHIEIDCHFIRDKITSQTNNSAYSFYIKVEGINNFDKRWTKSHSWDLLRTHIFPRTRELPQFPISPKLLFLSKNRLRNPPKRKKKFCTYANFLKKKKSFFRKFFFATGLVFERFLAPRSRFFEKVNGLGVLGFSGIYEQKYKFMHIGLVQIAIKPLFRIGIDAPVLLILRDKRHNDFENSILAMAETNIANRPIYFSCYPNFSVGLFDKNILDTLVLTVETKNLDFKDNTKPLAIIYRVCYKTMTTTIEPRTRLSSPKNETIIFEANINHTKIHTPKRLKWSEITQSCNLQNANEPKALDTSKRISILPNTRMVL
ncbi:hypothetical protein LXL04_021695 [Taraxacum kok-saghyz]